MTDKNDLSDLDQIRVKMLSAALAGSGILNVVNNQTNEAIKNGTVTITEATNHRKILLNQAAQTMGAGIAAALAALYDEGYIIDRAHVEEKEQPISSVPHIDGRGNTPVKNGDPVDDEAILGAPV